MNFQTKVFKVIVSDFEQSLPTALLVLQRPYQSNMSSVDQAQAVDAPAVVEAPAAKATKKTKVKGKDSSSGNPKYKDMVMDAIITQKERSGSSLGAIKNHLGSKYKVDVAKKAGILNRLQFIANITLMFVFNVY